LAPRNAEFKLFTKSFFGAKSLSFKRSAMQPRTATCQKMVEIIGRKNGRNSGGDEK
jgi:hypothetical protein